MSEIIYSRITEYIYVHTSQPFANHSRVMLGESAPIHRGDTKLPSRRPAGAPGETPGARAVSL